MLFCMQIRPSLVEEHPSWGVPELGKALGARWKALTEEEKVPFNKLQVEDKAPSSQSEPEPEVDVDP